MFYSQERQELTSAPAFLPLGAYVAPKPPQPLELNLVRRHLWRNTPPKTTVKGGFATAQGREPLTDVGACYKANADGTRDSPEDVLSGTSRTGFQGNALKRVKDSQNVRVVLYCPMKGGQ